MEEISGFSIDEGKLFFKPISVLLNNHGYKLYNISSVDKTNYSQTFNSIVSKDNFMIFFRVCLSFRAEFGMNFEVLSGRHLIQSKHLKLEERIKLSNENLYLIVRYVEHAINRIKESHTEDMKAKKHTTFLKISHFLEKKSYMLSDFVLCDETFGGTITFEGFSLFFCVVRTHLHDCDFCVYKQSKFFSVLSLGIDENWMLTDRGMKLLGERVEFAMDELIRSTQKKKDGGLQSQCIHSYVIHSPDCKSLLSLLRSMDIFLSIL
jgi:hypothetical protein